MITARAMSDFLKTEFVIRTRGANDCMAASGIQPQMALC